MFPASEMSSLAKLKAAALVRKALPPARRGAVTSFSGLYVAGLERRSLVCPAREVPSPVNLIAAVSPAGRHHEVERRGHRVGWAAFIQKK